MSACRSTFCACDREAKAFYFRVLGYGLCIEAQSSHVVMFSERNGYRKPWYLGPIVIEVLKP